MPGTAQSAISKQAIKTKNQAMNTENTENIKALELTETAEGRILECRITGRLKKEDYGLFVPETERLIEQHGKIRIYVELVDFHGWSAGALWEDIKFDLKHFRDIERIVIVGEDTWEKGMASFCKPFTTAEVSYFPYDRREEARAAVREGLPT